MGLKLSRGELSPLLILGLLVHSDIMHPRLPDPGVEEPTGWKICPPVTTWGPRHFLYPSPFTSDSLAR